MSGKTPNRPIEDAIARIGQGDDGLTAGGQITRDGGRAGVEFDKTLGKGWAIGAGGMWEKTKKSASDWAAWVGITWRPK